MSSTNHLSAGSRIYEAYKSGSLSSLNDKIFGEEGLTVSFDSLPDIPENSLGAAFPDGTTLPIEVADTIHGQSAENVQFDPSVYQFYDDTCAIQSQHLILEQYGIYVSQEELIEIAKENGWYAENYGTPVNMVGKLLEYYGVDVHASMGNNIFNLSNELAQGHQIIVGVDEYELVDPNDPRGWDHLNGEGANHALVVVGIDTSDPDNVQVIVTDPGTGNRQMAYSAEQFMEAWKDSDCFMVSTDSVPNNPFSEFSPIDSFAGIPIDTLERLSDMDFDIATHDMFDCFVNDLLADPTGLDDIIADYPDLFDVSTDDEFS